MRRDVCVRLLSLNPQYYAFISGIILSFGPKLLLDTLRDRTGEPKFGLTISAFLFTVAAFLVMRAAGRIEEIRISASHKQPPDVPSLNHAIRPAGRLTLDAKSAVSDLIGAAVGATIACWVVVYVV